MTTSSLSPLRLPLGRGRTAPAVVTAVVTAAVLVVAAGGGRHSAVVTGALLGVIVFAVAFRWPALGLGALVVVLPTQLVASALLFHVGLPGSAAHALGNVKDVLVLALVARACVERPWRRLDGVDRFALGYVALLTAYLVVPAVVPGVFGSAGFQPRLLEWRVLAYAALLVVAGRRLPLSRRAVRRVVVTAVVTGVVVGACAVFEAVRPSGWDSFMVSVVGLPAYKNQVIGLDVNSQSVISRTVLGGHSFVRSGSVFGNPLVAGFALYVAWAVTLTAFSRGRFRPAVLWAALAIGGGILVTVTRSAILGAVVIAFVVVWFGVRQRYAGRIRLALVLAAVVALAAPLAGSTSLGARTVAAVQGSDVSAQRHVESVQNGLRVLAHHPLGQGLGTGPGVGDRFGVVDKVTSEDFYLGVGDEAGVLGLALFVGLYASLLVALRRESRRPTRDAWLCGSLYAAGWGYAVGALFLHVWLDFTTSLTFFGLAGVLLASARSLPDEPLER